MNLSQWLILPFFPILKESNLASFNILWDQTVVILSHPRLFILFILDWDWELFGELFSHCACLLKWTHCVWKHPAQQLRRRGEQSTALKNWTLATAVCSCTRLWNVVCQLHQGFAKKRLYRPIMCAQRGCKNNVLSRALSQNQLKFVSRHYGNMVKTQFGTFFPLKPSASEGGILGAITERECGLWWGRGGDTVAKNVWICERKKLREWKRKWFRHCTFTIVCVHVRKKTRY